MLLNQCRVSAMHITSINLSTHKIWLPIPTRRLKIAIPCNGQMKSQILWTYARGPNWRMSFPFDLGSVTYIARASTSIMNEEWWSKIAKKPEVSAAPTVPPTTQPLGKRKIQQPDHTAKRQRYDYVPSNRHKSIYISAQTFDSMTDVTGDYGYTKFLSINITTHLPTG